MNIFSHLFVLKISMCVWKDKLKWKRGWGWPIKNILIGSVPLALRNIFIGANWGFQMLMKVRWGIPLGVIFCWSRMKKFKNNFLQLKLVTRYGVQDKNFEKRFQSDLLLFNLSTFLSVVTSAFSPLCLSVYLSTYIHFCILLTSTFCFNHFCLTLSLCNSMH